MWGSKSRGLIICQEYTAQEGVELKSESRSELCPCRCPHQNQCQPLEVSRLETRRKGEEAGEELLRWSSGLPGT